MALTYIMQIKITHDSWLAVEYLPGHNLKPLQ